MSVRRWKTGNVSGSYYALLEFVMFLNPTSSGSSSGGSSVDNSRWKRVHRVLEICKQFACIQMFSFPHRLNFCSASGKWNKGFVRIDKAKCVNVVGVVLCFRYFLRNWSHLISHTEIQPLVCYINAYTMCANYNRTCIIGKPSWEITTLQNTVISTCNICIIDSSWPQNN